MLSKKSSLIDRLNSSGLLARSARRDVETISFTPKRPRTALSVLQSLAAVKTSKIRLSRDFRSSSIFDFSTAPVKTGSRGFAAGGLLGRQRALDGHSRRSV